VVGTRTIATFPQEPLKQVRVVRRADGYDVQCGVQAQRPVAHHPPGKQLGVDVGLASFTTDSEGLSTPTPRSLRQAERDDAEAVASAGLAERERVEEPRASPEAGGQRLFAGEQAA